MENLHTSLLEIQIILDKVQSSGCNDTKWKTLMQELKDAAYDAEDLIDEFQPEQKKTASFHHFNWKTASVKVS
ncbi:hypothetical protein ZIOFF_032930 [Zingiber officinale]|uniref:Disease resistance N-terminal domain-containing protein n=1 Tax=Zingiber officinale TaxID=94328 RepID=A0A8J5GNF1_ZINOF|nr:hypothetical protein ZIOFF_032930 [Zingiber officinale]